MLKQISTKELEKNLAKVEKINQEIHQIKWVIFKYIKPIISHGKLAFNNLFGKWSSNCSEQELDNTLQQIRGEWAKENKEII